MAESELSAQQRDLIERIGVLHDRLGYPPAPGRVLGLLLVSSESELTFDRIRKTLGLSKSSTSNAVNLLLRVGSIEYTTRPGDRKRYFRKRYDAWEDHLLERLDLFFSLGPMLSEAVDLRRGGSEEALRATERMADFLSYLKDEIHSATESWKQGGANGATNT